jgi:dTDP-4-dehydrorhamnose reductase
MGARPSIFLTGKNGQVGFELQRTLGRLGKVIPVDIEDFDLADPDAVRQNIRGTQPDLIVNPAAYTAVDRAEQEPDLAFAVNAQAPRVLAEEARRLKIPIIHYSTDYVFDGKKRSPYTEGDSPNPQSVYGESKLAGEASVSASGARHIILRLSWVYGPRGENFLRTMLSLGRKRKEIKVVDDQTGAPTWSQSIAEASAVIAARLLESQNTAGGIYHLPAGGTTTWFEYARAIFDLAGEHLSFPRPHVLPISSLEYPTAAPRPSYSVLSGARIQADYRIALPHWRDQLALAISHVNEQKG